MRTYKGKILTLEPHQIYMCGTNTQGRHGSGAAKKGVEFGLVYGRGSGLMGRAYGIITKDLTKKIHPSIPPDMIIRQLEIAYHMATPLTKDEFVVAYHGSEPNLNAYTPMEMAEMFVAAGPIPENFRFEEGFAKLIESI